MHLWPSAMLRDSFKVEYLKTMGRNLNRMNTEKRQPQQNQSDCRQQQLLETDKRDSEDTGSGGICVFVRELFLILSCCYCCFGCGACIDDEESR